MTLNLGYVCCVPAAISNFRVVGIGVVTIKGSAKGIMPLTRANLFFFAGSWLPKTISLVAPMIGQLAVGVWTRRNKSRNSGAIGTVS